MFECWARYPSTYILCVQAARAMRDKVPKPHEMANIFQTISSFLLYECVWNFRIKSESISKNVHQNPTANHYAITNISYLKLNYGKCSKISNTFLFLFSVKMLIFSAGINKILVRLSKTGKTLIRLLLQKQSDLGLHCLHRPYWQSASVRNFRTFIINTIGYSYFAP